VTKGALYAVVGTVAGILAGLLVAFQAAEVVLVLIAIGLATAWFLRLDGWQRLYAITITLLFCATSNQPALASVSFYPRFGAAALLAVYTWSSIKGGVRKLASFSQPTRLLIKSLWIIVILAFASTVWSADIGTTMQQAAALGIFVFLLHGLLTRRWVDPDRIPGDLAVGFIVLSVTFAGSIAADTFGITVTRTFNGRFQGLYSNPNTLASIAALTLLVGWALWLQKRSPMYLLGIGVTAVALVLTESRTAVAAVIIGIAFTMLRSSGGAMARALYFGAIAAFGLVLLAPGLGFTAPATIVGTVDRFSANDGGDLLNSRTVAWGAAVDLWQAKPFTGYGYQAGESLFVQRFDAGSLGFNRPSTHNSYLQFLLELGLIGVLFLVPALLSVARAMFRERPKGFGVGLIAAIVAGLAIQVTESAMFGTGQAYPYIFWLVVLAALIRSEPSPDAPGEDAEATDFRPAARAESGSFDDRSPTP
jgi:O-antigen ligase